MHIKNIVITIGMSRVKLLQRKMETTTIGIKTEITIMVIMKCNPFSIFYALKEYEMKMQSKIIVKFKEKSLSEKM